MSERRLPIYARWTLHALGSVPDRDPGRPRCPVSAWMLATRTAIRPHDPDPDRLAAVRVRTDLMDDLLLQVRDKAASVGRRMSVWNVGCGFDARWARLAGPMSPTITRWVEVDEPSVLTTKGDLLQDSPFQAHWDRVETLPMVPIGWGVEPEPGEWPVILLEGLLHRVPTQGLRTLLLRIRETAPHAHLLLDLTGVYGRSRIGWSARHVARLGWRVIDDVELGFRDPISDPDGYEVSCGMVPVRVLHLVGSEPTPLIAPRRRRRPG